MHDAKKHANQKVIDSIIQIATNGQELDALFRDFLRKKGSSRFSIVEIGTAVIDGRKHWIYTGSEQARVAERATLKNPLGFLKPVSAQ